MKERKQADKKRFLKLLDELVEPNDRLPPATSPERVAPRERGPCGKMVFPSEASAKQACRYRLRKGSNTGKLRTYFCKKCSGWHMSSSFKDF